MKGSVQTDKKSGRLFILIYWNGRQYRFWKDPNSGLKFTNQRHAGKLLNYLRTEIDKGTFLPDEWFSGKKTSSLLVKNYAPDWLKRHKVTAKTLKDYRSNVNNYIIPFFGDRDMGSITHNDLLDFESFIERCSKGKYNVLGTLRVMMKVALKIGDITKVPEFPTVKYTLPEPDYLVLDEQEKIIAAIPERHRPIFRLMQEYGVRPGEARALMKDCLRHGYVTITRAFSENLLRETTKTGRTRKYKITQYFQEILDSIPTHQSDFVFVRDDGKPYTSKSLNGIWHKALKDANMREIRLYNGTRHSLAFQLLEQGEELSLVQEQLGHANIGMTRRYATRPKERLAEALNRRRSGQRR